MNSASPLFSAILLGSDGAATAPERDGMLEARELFDLDLHARFAVFTDGAALSMRAAAPTVDVVGWSWRAAGVPSIVVPRWAADPAATTLLLTDAMGMAEPARLLSELSFNNSPALGEDGPVMKITPFAPCSRACIAL